MLRSNMYTCRYKISSSQSHTARRAIFNPPLERGLACWLRLIRRGFILKKSPQFLFVSRSHTLRAILSPSERPSRLLGTLDT